MIEKDARVARTKQMIKTAFFELMETVGFEKINVRNLTEKAKINRSTFYLHYADKYDLLNQIENESLAELKNIIMDMPADILLTKGFDDKTPFAIMYRVYDYIKSNCDFFTLAMRNPAFIHKMSELFREVMMSKHIEARLGIPERYAIACIVGIQTSLINEWLQGGMKETPDEIAKILSGIFKNLPQNVWQSKNHFIDNIDNQNGGK